MTKYYCPDHPDQLLAELLDDEMEDWKTKNRTEIFSAAQILVCPIDQKSYYLHECPTS